MDLINRPVGWGRLRSRLAGAVVRPGDVGWEAAKRPQMARFAHVQPMAVVYARHASDVATTLEFIRQQGLPFAVRSGRHDFAGHSTSAGVVLDVSMIDHVRVAGGRAMVGAGARLGDAYRRLDESGRTLPGGCGATVGIAGLTLGGGLGVLGRRHGLLCDQLRAATLVLADGSTVTCDDDRDSDLFWALRGAGHGHFGVVTELAYDTIPSPPCVVFAVQWDGAQVVDVVNSWQRWAPGQAERLAASLLLNAPAEPGEPVRATLLGAAHDTDADAARELLRGFATDVGSAPTRSQLWEAPWLEAKEFLADIAPGDDAGPVYSKSEFHRAPLPPDAVDELIAALAERRAAGEARELDFSPWGGAYNAASPTATAFPHRDARFLLKHAATLTATGPAQAELATPGPWCQRSWEIAHRHGTGGVYPNFPDDELADPGTAYFGANLGRLRGIKRAYDPASFFRPVPA